MRLRYVKARNFLSFEDITIPLDKSINIIVGPNNSGKTNLARTLKLMVDSIRGNVRGLDFTSFLHNISERSFRLEIGYELDTKEKEDILKFINVYFFRLSFYFGN